MRSPWQNYIHKQPDNTRPVWVRNGFKPGPPVLAQNVGSWAGFACQRLDIEGGDGLHQDNMVWQPWWPALQWRPTDLPDVGAWTGMLDGLPSDGQTVWAFLPFVRSIAAPLIWEASTQTFRDDALSLPDIPWYAISYWLPR